MADANNSAAPATLPLERLSLNQITVKQLSLPEVVEACGRFGIGTISAWRDPIAEVGIDEAERVVKDAGLRVSSVCRGGFFPYKDDLDRQRMIADNRAAVEEAARLGADCLVLVCGGATGDPRDIDRARDQIREGIELLLPYAIELDVPLGIEPLHPAMVTRSAITSLGEANDLAESFDSSHVGVVIDVYHVFWDKYLEREIRRCGANGNILGFHVCDWLDVPSLEIFQGRGMMGDGVIDIPRIRSLIDEAGYDGPIEVEVISAANWQRPADSVIQDVIHTFQESA